MARWWLVSWHDSRTRRARVDLVYLVCLVDLVCFVYLVDLVHLVSFVQPKNQTDQTNQTDQEDRTDKMNKTGSRTVSSSCQKNREGRQEGSDNCQNTVAELPSVILRRSSWLSKKMMPRSVPVSYRRFTSVSNPVQLKNLTGPPAICPGVRSSEP